jgi:hypothetical protein
MFIEMLLRLYEMERLPQEIFRRFLEPLQEAHDDFLMLLL